MRGYEILAKVISAPAIEARALAQQQPRLRQVIGVLCIPLEEIDHRNVNTKGDYGSGEPDARGEASAVKVSTHYASDIHCILYSRFNTGSFLCPDGNATALMNELQQFSQQGTHTW